ncbi:hypothetical protein LTR36_004520 [Oleoguttula mirabilis]|uniref:Catalase n=1 Tax=Oleoguttula mirabilis TaxID=1507867 RepID=A0AAV9JFX6_9PEZI|nr:hypothetical protein LTR36_004520 [Oleoguttula mirabilis]
MDDWQDAAFNHRRIPHGRSKKRGKAAGKTGAGVFNPKTALGLYELSGTAINTLLAETDDKKACFEIHELTETPGGFIGSLLIGNRMKAAMILAGSRKLLAAIVADENSVDEDETSSVEADDPQTHADHDEDETSSVEGEDLPTQTEHDDTEAETELEARDRKDNERVAAFGKNSFRAPKFWLHWQGDVTTKDGEEVRERNQGYVSFAGNECSEFQSTMSCKALGWKDASMHGRRVTGRARRAPFASSDFGLPNPGEGAETDSGLAGRQ